MRRKQVSHVRYGAWIGLALLACLAAPLAAQATEPMMTVRSVDGDSTVYAVSQIQRLTFVADTLKVAAYGRVDHFQVDQVSKIRFLWWESAGIDGSGNAASVMKSLRLLGNRPNPFSLETRIAFDLPKTGPVDLMIYSVDGRVIRTLLKENLAPGRHEVVWDGRDDGGRKVAGGTYFYRLSAPGVDGSRRLILLP